jgi:hypothetical protein
LGHTLINIEYATKDELKQRIEAGNPAKRKENGKRLKIPARLSRPDLIGRAGSVIDCCVFCMKVYNEAFPMGMEDPKRSGK